ncbi:hypothetical protein HMN09_01163800 [Mycena chlorophos]|uniref:Uncharacterized protein n=1 Tax=Mycena chlorophos TaxID=658473 RepID=A0A8H6VWC3_MYCCL|nr:hypothetical protein HMN09_01163800 [Mycena chlorophos]
MDGIKKEYEAKLAKSVAEVAALEELLTSLLLRITAPKAGGSEASAAAGSDAGAGAASGSSGSSSGLGAEGSGAESGDVGSARESEDADAETAALWASVEQINALIAMEVDQQQSFQTLIRSADLNRPASNGRLGPRPGLDLKMNDDGEAVVDVKGKGKAKAVDLDYLQWA